MKHQITITEADLNAAIAVPWSTCTCVVAQALTRELGSKPMCCGRDKASLEDGRRVYMPQSFSYLTWEFDRAHEANHGDVNELRSLLPLTDFVEVNE